MGHLLDQRLIPRLASPKAGEPDRAAIQVHLGSHEPVGPALIHLEGPAQHLSTALGIGSSHLHHPARERSLEVQSPVPRERPSRRCRLDPIRSMPPQRRHMPARPIDQIVQIGVLEPGPDPSLPRAVVVLDRCLETRLARRHEHRDHPQAQAKSADPTYRVGMGVRPLEDRVVVELGVARQTELPPVLGQALDDELGGAALIARPRGHQAAMQRDPVEHLDLRAIADDQPLDDVEAVEFLAAAGHLRQVPARWRWGSSDPMPMIQGAATAQDAVDGPFRGERFDPAGSQILEDRLGPEEAQVALGLQLAAHLKDQILDGPLGPLSDSGDRWAIGPIHPVETLAVRVADPAVNGRGAYAEVPCDFMLRSAASDGLDHGPAAAGLPISLLRVGSSLEVSFLTSLPHEVDDLGFKGAGNEVAFDGHRETGSSS